MASQSKYYRGNKFGVNELSDTFKKIALATDANLEKIYVSHSFKKDGVNDKEKLSLKEAGRITVINEEESITLRLGFGRYVSLNPGFNTNELSISVSAGDVDKVKKIFSILESELNLEEFDYLEENNDNAENEEKPEIEETKTIFKTKLSQVRLYKEDLEDIIDLIKNVYGEVYIKIDELKIRDKSQIEDVRKKLRKDSVHNLTISSGEHAFGSRINLNLTEHNANITVYNKRDYESMGVLFHLEEIISKKENKVLRILLYSYKLTFLALAAIIIPFLITIVYDNLLDSYFYVLMAWNIIWLSLLCYPLIMSFRKHSTIYLTYSNKESWIEKHSSDIIVGIFVEVIVGIITALILHFLNL